MMPRLRRLLWPGLATLAAFAILVSLGIWQLARRDWKHDLIVRIEARAHGPAGEVGPEAEWPRWRAADEEFRRVSVSGTFEHAAATPVHGLLHDRPGRPLQGYYVLTPLRRADGSRIIVNRGFVPPEERDAQLRGDTLPEEAAVTVTGLLRASEVRGWFQPPNRPDSWFVRDTGEMARLHRLGRVAPFYLEAEGLTGTSAWPRGGQARLTLPDNHLQYALTWFGLAGALLAVFIAFARRRWADPIGPSLGQDAGHEISRAPRPS